MDNYCFMCFYYQKNNYVGEDKFIIGRVNKSYLDPNTTFPFIEINAYFVNVR